MNIQVHGFFYDLLKVYFYFQRCRMERPEGQEKAPPLFSSLFITS